MSTSSSASSTLTRSRLALLAVATIVTALAGYHIYSTYAYQSEISSLPGTGVHRSNAVHRRRRRATTTNSAPTPLLVDDQVENDGEGQVVARTLTDGETVVDDQEYPWASQAHAYQRSGQNIVQLLFRVSEDATRRNAYVHRGCLCNSCGVVPIRGIRYRCANCADYDLCENCESQGVHSKAHIFYKIKVPAPAFGPRHIQPVWYTGDPGAVESQLPKHISTKLSRETGFERPELDAYWEQWTYMANTEWRDDPDDIRLAMDRRTFERCLVPSGGYRLAAPSLIFDRMFAFYDTNKDDLIGFSEFLHGIAFRKKKDKLKKIYEGYDIDGDGYVDRKDFLRIFRSYYVLFRSMHQDMLEGMEDQQMGTNEAHRLVTSRQPLSSAFGQDGRFPRAPDPRTGEGKAKRADGDEEVTDGKGVISENGTDTGNREDVFRYHLNRGRRDATNEDWITRTTGFWGTLIAPPDSIEQMSAVIDNLGLRPELNEILQNVIGAEAQPENGILRQPFNPPDYTLDGSDQANEEADDSEEEWPPTSINILDEDVEAIEGPGVAIADVRPSRRAVVISRATQREKAQRQIYERWQRRHFYTDEEEGGVPPAEWKDEDDLLARTGLAGEIYKPPTTRHSRSSSKVRFAEDMDDFDTRSNPSTSSRSVPERWGGMDLPDAEKDAGKEILFQVTQQAFNELLDPIFKASEDLAMEVAATKAERDLYRSVWESHEFEEWALEREASEKENDPPSPAKRTPGRRNSVWPTFPEVEVEEIRERTLGELLAATGYAVEAGSSVQVVEGSRSGEPLERVRDRDEHSGSSESSPSQLTPEVSEPDSPTYRDPTLPQFRPSTSIPTPSSQDSSSSPPPPPKTPSPTTTSTPSPAMLPKLTTLPFSPIQILADPEPDPSTETPSDPSNPSSQTQQKDDKGLLKERAYHLWKCDKAEEEAEMRGGFGRLNFAEFEDRVKKWVATGGGGNTAVGLQRSAQMEYLGSWIEFCIP